MKYIITKGQEIQLDNRKQYSIKNTIVWEKYTKANYISDHTHTLNSKEFIFYNQYLHEYSNFYIFK